MYIRRVSKTNGRSRKKYSYLHLVENIRTEKGPRQKLILNLGDLPVDESQFVSLARRIEELLTGQASLLEMPKELEKHARAAAKKLFHKQASEISASDAPIFENVDVNSIEASMPRSIGPEFICCRVWEELMLDELLKNLGVSTHALPILKALVISRLIQPGSERSIHGWVNHQSALYELTGTPLRGSLQSFYRGTDKLLSLKEEIEKHLGKREADIFSLEDSIYLYDLTNTYFEGRCRKNSKAKFGKSKEKRTDCRIATLGMVVDELGFAKYSELFAGNKYEGETLEAMIKGLENHTGKPEKKLIVMDAGISREENLKWLKEKGYDYVTVSRKHKKLARDVSEMSVVKETREGKIEIKRLSEDTEVYLLVKSEAKRKKEESIRGRVEELFLAKLEYYKSGLTKKGRTKGHEKMLEVIGRLKEKYPQASKLYHVTVVPEEGSDVRNRKAIDIKWEKKERKYSDELKDEGSYILRTSRMDLTDEQIFRIYSVLRRIEDSFKDMKSHLGFRPNFHQTEFRADAHMFISVLAYHVLHHVEHKLRKAGDNRSWRTIRSIMRTHERVTFEYDHKDENGNKYHKQIRICTKLEPEQVEIYRKLGLPLLPLPRKIISMENP